MANFIEFTRSKNLNKPTFYAIERDLGFIVNKMSGFENCNIFVHEFNRLKKSGDFKLKIAVKDLDKFSESEIITVKYDFPENVHPSIMLAYLLKMAYKEYTTETRKVLFDKIKKKKA